MSKELFSEKILERIGWELQLARVWPLLKDVAAEPVRSGYASIADSRANWRQGLGSWHSEVAAASLSTRRR